MEKRLAALEKLLAEAREEGRKRTEELQRKAVEEMRAGERRGELALAAVAADARRGLSQVLAKVNGLAPPAFPERVFLGRSASGSDNTFTEQIALAGSIVDGGTDWRNCSSSSHASALILARASTGIMSLVLEMADTDDHRYARIPIVPYPSDMTKDYVLTWDSASKAFAWVEIGDCP